MWDHEEWLCSFLGGQGFQRTGTAQLACFDRGAREETSRVWVDGPSWTSGFFMRVPRLGWSYPTSKPAEEPPIAGCNYFVDVFKNAV